MYEDGASDDLIFSAFLSAENLIKKYGGGFYRDLQFDGFTIPHIEIEVLADLIMRDLRANDFIPEGIRVRIDMFAFQNDVKGVVQYNLKKKLLRITVASNMNTCWRRFVICKELCQAYIDLKSGTPSAYGFKAVEDQVYDLVSKHNRTIANFESLNEEHNDPNNSEFHAFLMAVNLVFPYRHRPDFKELIDKKRQPQSHLTLYDAASAYRMPEFVLDFFSKKLLPYYETQKYQYMTAYVDFFRKDLGLYLKPGIGLQITTVPYSEGGILKISIKRDGTDGGDEVATPAPSVQDALEKAELEIEDADGKEMNPKIKGTNIVLSKNAIYILKDTARAEWTSEQAAADVDKIIND